MLATLGFEHDVFLSGLFALGFISPMFRLRPLTAVLLAIPGKCPEVYAQKTAKDESLAAAEVQSAFAVSPALLTAQMIKHLRLRLQQLFFTNDFYALDSPTSLCLSYPTAPKQPLRPC